METIRSYIDQGYIETLLILMAMVYVALCCRYDKQRLYPVMISLSVSIVSYSMYYWGPYNWAISKAGYFIYQSIFPLLCFVALRRIKGPLSTLLMITAFTLILVNFTALCLVGGGLYNWGDYQFAVWVILLVELALMYSPRLTNGCYGGLCEFKLGRDYTEGYSLYYSLSYSVKNHFGKG